MASRNPFALLAGAFRACFLLGIFCDVLTACSQTTTLPTTSSRRKSRCSRSLQAALAWQSMQLPKGPLATGLPSSRRSGERCQDRRQTTRKRKRKSRSCPQPTLLPEREHNSKENAAAMTEVGSQSEVEVIADAYFRHRLWTRKRPWCAPRNWRTRSRTTRRTRRTPRKA